MTVEAASCHGNAPGSGCCNLGSGLALQWRVLHWVSASPFVTGFDRPRQTPFFPAILLPQLSLSGVKSNSGFPCLPGLL